MISVHQGDLLAADVDALVNAVNTVGVMGKGIALGSLPLHGGSKNRREHWRGPEVGKPAQSAP